MVDIRLKIALLAQNAQQTAKTTAFALFVPTAPNGLRLKAMSGSVSETSCVDDQE